MTAATRFPVTDASGRRPSCPADLTTVLDPSGYADGTVLDLAGPLAAGETVLDEVVPARAPWSAVVRAGQVLTIVDVGGNQSGDCLLYSAADTAERYSAPDTISWSGNAYVRTGTVLRSNLGNALATVTGNEVDRQDTIGGACSKESNTLRYGHHTMAEHGCRENFLAEAAKYGMGARDLVSNLNWFMNVPVEPDGTLGIVDGISGPGKRVAVRAGMDILVLISNCPQMNNPCNEFNPTPLRVIITEAPETGA
jgi:urea carboxylase-associated protein 1